VTWHPAASNLPPFIRFIIVGAVAAFVNVVARIGFSQFIAFNYAVVLAFPFGLTTAYLLSRRFVFQQSGLAASTEYIRFTLINLIALAQVWIVSVGLAEWIFPAIGFKHYPELVAHTIGVCSPIVTSYFGHKSFTFRRLRAAVKLTAEPSEATNENKDSSGHAV
jgi:putative flippase GtrA